MTSTIQSFAGVSTPAFLIVGKVTFSTLPTSRIKSMEVALRDGAYFIDKTYGIKVFNVEVAIKADDAGEVMYRTDDLAAWLNYKTPQKLVFRDKPNMYYMAIVDNTIDITKFSNSGKGQITFVCFDPHGYGAERVYSFNPTNDEPINLSNGGNTDTAPVMEMTFNEDVTDFVIATNNDMLYFGEPFDVSTKTVKNLNPKILSDTMQTTNGWTQGLTVDGGIVAGTLSAGVNTFAQTEKNYGVNGSGWHGGSMIKDLGKQIQDFTVEAVINHKASTRKQIGRVEIYLLDINGNKLGKIALVDNWGSGEIPKFEARAGNLDSGKYFVNQWGSKQITWAQFYGTLRISRKGKKWTAYIGKTDSKGRHHSRLTKTWTDSKSLYQGKVAAIQVHVGMLKTYAVTNLLTVNHVKVTEHLAKATNEVSYVFETGDTLEIDNNTNEILKNGEPFYEDLYPSSSFIKLDKGVNGISVSEPVITNGTITFRERWV